jgi:hypothetical protein
LITADVCWGNLWDRDNLENPGVDGRIILRWMFMKGDGGMDRIDLTQDTDRWQDLVTAVMRLWVT